jgi:hypothetical protein
MVEYLERYKQLLANAAEVYSKLIELYMSSAPADQDAARNAGEAGVYRKGLLEDIALPRQVLTIEDTSPFIVSTRHYLDSHWADFTTYPVASPDNKEYPATDLTKRQRLLALHAELEGIIKAVAQIDVALR